MSRPPIFESYSAELPPVGNDGLPISKPAVFGFISSLLLCIPFLGGLGGVILGGIGFWQIRRKQAIGKPLALTAIVMGVASILLWATGIAGMAVVGVRFAEVEESARGFVEALAEGDLDKARQLASSNVSDEQLRDWQAELAAGETDPQVVMWNLSFDEEDEEDDWGVGRIWGGPYRVTGEVHYRPKKGEEPPQGRRATVVVTHHGRGFRVDDMIVRTPARPLPDPEELLEELRSMEELRKMENLPGIHVRPPTRPAPPADRP